MAFNPPLGSTSPAVLLDNAKRLDELANGPAAIVPDRAGQPLDSWRQMMAKNEALTEATRQNLIPLSRQYMTLSEAQADIANIPVGSTTYYRSPDDSALAVEVINNAGTLVATGREMLSAGGVQGEINKRLVPGDYSPSMVPLFHDRKGNVPVYLDNGKLDAAGLGPVLQQIVAEIPNDLVGQMIRQYTSFSPSFFPVLHDADDRVYVWMDGGFLDAAGLGPVLQDFIKNFIGADGLSASSFIEGDQYKFTFKRGRVFNGQAASINVAFTGDSWTERNTIPQSLINVLGGNYKDPGWISCSTRTDGVMSGISLTVTNFNKYDGGSNNTNPPPYGCGPDGNGYYNSNTVGSLAWTGVTATDLSVFYYDGSGSFTITIDSGAPVTINGGNTGTAKKYDLSGLSATAHSVTIQSLGAGVVSIFGMYGKNSAVRSGVTVSRMGNGGAIGSDFFNFSSWITPTAQYLDIDLLFVILGTNDFRLGKGISEYRDGLIEIINKYREAIPGICICLVSPGHCNATATPGLDAYDQVMRQLAVEYNINFISGYQLFPKTYNNSNGAWDDALHLSSFGAYVITRKIKDEFFQE